MKQQTECRALQIFRSSHFIVTVYTTSQCPQFKAAFEKTMLPANTVYVGDITCISTRESGLYSAVVLDLFSRACCWLRHGLTHEGCFRHGVAAWKRKPERSWCGRLETKA